MTSTSNNNNNNNTNNNVLHTTLETYIIRTTLFEKNSNSEWTVICTTGDVVRVDSKVDDIRAHIIATREKLHQGNHWFVKLTDIDVDYWREPKLDCNCTTCSNIKLKPCRKVENQLTDLVNVRKAGPRMSLEELCLEYLRDYAIKSFVFCITSNSTGLIVYGDTMPLEMEQIKEQLIIAAQHKLYKNQIMAVWNNQADCVVVMNKDIIVAIPRQPPHELQNTITKDIDEQEKDKIKIQNHAVKNASEVMKSAFVKPIMKMIGEQLTANSLSQMVNNLAIDISKFISGLIALEKINWNVHQKYYSINTNLSEQALSDTLLTWNVVDMKSTEHGKVLTVMSDKLDKLFASASGKSIPAIKCSNPVCTKQNSVTHIFKVCSACKSASYCSVECQRVHWNPTNKDVQSHKAACTLVRVKATSAKNTEECKLKCVLHTDCKCAESQLQPFKFILNPAP